MPSSCCCARDTKLPDGAHPLRISRPRERSARPVRRIAKRMRARSAPIAHDIVFERHYAPPRRMRSSSRNADAQRRRPEARQGSGGVCQNRVGHRHDRARLFAFEGLLGHGAHELKAIYLVDRRSPGIVVDGGDIGLRIAPPRRRKAAPPGDAPQNGTPRQAGRSEWAPFGAQR